MHGIHAGSDGIRAAHSCGNRIFAQASRKTDGIRRGIRRDPTDTVSWKCIFRLKLLQIYAWDPCGLRQDPRSTQLRGPHFRPRLLVQQTGSDAGSDGIRPIWLKLLQIYARDPCGFRRDPRSAQLRGPHFRPRLLAKQTGSDEGSDGIRPIWLKLLPIYARDPCGIRRDPRSAQLREPHFRPKLLAKQTGSDAGPMCPLYIHCLFRVDSFSAHSCAHSLPSPKTEKH